MYHCRKSIVLETTVTTINEQVEGDHAICTFVTPILFTNNERNGNIYNTNWCRYCFGLSNRGVNFMFRLFCGVFLTLYMDFVNEAILIIILMHSVVE